MIFAVDFDGTIVKQEHAYDDLEAPLEFMPGAYEALKSLKAAGHTIIVVSARANRALRVDSSLNPLWRRNLENFDFARWKQNQKLNQLRYTQMCVFVQQNLQGVVDAVDDGAQGKVCATHFIDDRNVDFSHGWAQIAQLYGESE